MRVVMLAFSHAEYAIELAEGLSKIEDICLFLPIQDYRRFEPVIKKQLKIFCFNKPRLRDPRYLAMIVKIALHIQRIKPDVIHIQHFPGEYLWFDLLLLPLLMRSYKLVVTIHDVILHSGDKASSRVPFIHKFVDNYACQFIVHGQYLKKEFIHEYEAKADCIHIIPRGINSIFGRYPNTLGNEEPNTVLFFGRIWEYKGLRYLIEAEPIISRDIPDVKIIIAGSGEDFNKYEKMMVNRERFAVYNKNIPDKEVGRFFSKAAVVVLPYTDASQSAIIPLAYAFRKPVVVTNVGSLPEVVEDGVTGHVVPSQNAGKLAEAIIDILNNGEKRSTMAEKAYKKAVNELSWDRIAMETSAVYRKVICPAT